MREGSDLKTSDVRRARGRDKKTQREKEGERERAKPDRLRDGACGTSGADKSQHRLRWEHHHGDELN